MGRKRIALLGATGSIGGNTLRVIRGNPERLELVAVAGHSRYRELAAIARAFGVGEVAIFDQGARRKATEEGVFEPSVTLSSGMEGLKRIATLPEVDLVVLAIVGTTGLEPCLSAIEAGKDIALASKEVLVMAGQFVMAAIRRNAVRLLPVDSEHNAIFQCLQGSRQKEAARILLTASGGPFREYDRARMSAVQPEDATRHPNWSMGPKITVDSSTMANKGLELIEARWLFGMEPSQIEVVVHPQSIVHSMVEFVDGSILAQLSPPSMTFAIQNTLMFPDRVSGVENSLDFSRSMQLDFHPPDPERFPCLKLAREALEAGGIAPTVFNAVNEVAVASFLDHRIPYPAIPEVIEKSLAKLNNFDPVGLEDVLEADAYARKLGREIILENHPE